MREVQDGEAGVRAEYRGNGNARRGGLLLLVLGVLFGASAAWRFRAPLDPFHLVWAVSLTIGAALCLALGGLQLWVWRHPFRLTFGREGITVLRAGTTRAVPWEGISRVAVEPASPTFRAVCLKVWPSPVGSLPRRTGSPTGDGAVAVCQLNTIDGTAEELAASVQHFAPPG